MSCKILLIDDDRDLCHILKKHLEAHNYLVSMRYDGQEGIREALRGEYELIILDVMLPIKNGFEVLKEIRNIRNVPILMLTAKDSEVDKISGLRMGADDYMTKPFSTAEFIARVQSIIRRYTVLGTELTADKIICGDIEMDTEKRSTKIENQLIELTAKEFDLLFFLMKNKGKVFTKQQLYRAVWNDEYSYDYNNIMVHIRRLRKKIEKDADNPTMILTVWGVGYKFRDNHD